MAEGVQGTALRYGGGGRSIKRTVRRRHQESIYIHNNEGRRGKVFRGGLRWEGYGGGDYYNYIKHANGSIRAPHTHTHFSYIHIIRINDPARPAAGSFPALPRFFCAERPPPPPPPTTKDLSQKYIIIIITTLAACCSKHTIWHWRWCAQYDAGEGGGGVPREVINSAPAMSAVLTRL